MISNHIYHSLLHLVLSILSSVPYFTNLNLDNPKDLLRYAHTSSIDFVFPIGGHLTNLLLFGLDALGSVVSTTLCFAIFLALAADMVLGLVGGGGERGVTTGFL